MFDAFMSFILDMNLYQYLLLGLSIFMVSREVVAYCSRQAGKTFLKVLIRFIVWGGVGVIAAYPNITIHFARVIGVVDNINAAIITGFVMIFILIFKLMSAIEKIEQNISELTRNDALKQLEDTAKSDGHHNKDDAPDQEATP